MFLCNDCYQHLKFHVNNFYCLEAMARTVSGWTEEQGDSNIRPPAQLRWVRVLQEDMNNNIMLLSVYRHIHSYECFILSFYYTNINAISPLTFFMYHGYF